MDLPVAQRAFGKERPARYRRYHRRGWRLRRKCPGAPQKNLGGAAEAERPKKRGEQIEQLLTSFRVGLFFVSLIALFVGFFLIYNTMSVSVIQRKREIGALRCLGMRRGQLLRLILAEALLLAIAAALSGALLGWLLAQAALIAVGRDRGNLFSFFDVASVALELA